MQKAVLAAEDRSFYENRGISPTGIARAFWNNLRGGATQGGSTITQQYAKNAYLSSGAHLHAQVQGVLHRGQAGPPRRQGQDPRGLPQHHLLRPRRLRHPDRGADLLRQGRRRTSPIERGRGPGVGHPVTGRLRPGERTPTGCRPGSTTCSTAWSAKGWLEPSKRAGMQVPPLAEGKKPRGGTGLLPAGRGAPGAQGERLHRPGHRPRRAARHHDVRQAVAAGGGPRGAAGAARGERHATCTSACPRSSRAPARSSRCTAARRQVSLNEATQARVQPGSSFKAFTLAGALERRHQSEEPVLGQLAVRRAGHRQGGQQRVRPRLRLVRRPRHGHRAVHQHRVRRPDPRDGPAEGASRPRSTPASPRTPRVWTANAVEHAGHGLGPQHRHGQRLRDVRGAG